MFTPRQTTENGEGKGRGFSGSGLGLKRHIANAKRQGRTSRSTPGQHGITKGAIRWDPATSPIVYIKAKLWVRCGGRTTHSQSNKLDGKLRQETTVGATNNKRVDENNIKKGRNKLKGGSSSIHSHGPMKQGKWVPILLSTGLFGYTGTTVIRQHSGLW